VPHLGVDLGMSVAVDFAGSVRKRMRGIRTVCCQKSQGLTVTIKGNVYSVGVGEKMRDREFFFEHRNTSKLAKIQFFRLKKFIGLKNMITCKQFL
jgi:hypothetical protein